MNGVPFILNNRFIINPSIGTVVDQQTNQTSRIEPRLMNLLCLLVKHKGELVNRSLITKEIWDDYGNADEGLTQAVSYLRKVLADEQKRIIETVPKKGYILYAEISEPVINPGLNIPKKTNRFKNILFISFAFLLLASAYFIYKTFSTQKQTGVDTLQQSPSTNNNPHSSGKVNNPDILPDSAKKKNSTDTPKK